MTNPTLVYGAPVQLGREQAYVEHYDASLLQPIARSECRQHLAIQDFYGCDRWSAYEVSWLDPTGKPCVAVLEFEIPANTTHIIESKSFKYYLNSLNQTPFASMPALLERLTQDVSAAAGGPVTVRPLPQGLPPVSVTAQCVDGLPLAQAQYHPNAALLQAKPCAQGASPVLLSHLLKSNCPVTGQPDWASVWVGCEGVAIEPASFLAYVVSYRQHQDFHENCVEQIYNHIWQTCAPSQLWVYARYTRRGGLDINPYRSSQPSAPPPVWAFRQ